MNDLFSVQTLRFDANQVDETIQRALASAGLDTTAGPMHDVTEIIRRAMSFEPRVGNAHAERAGPIEIAVTVSQANVAVRHCEDPTSPSPVAKHAPGAFMPGEFGNQDGRRQYRLYVPKSAEKSSPMIVMLHGCTQSAGDFAAGTQMNRLADEHGFLVLYPEQAAKVNASRCWNWFEPQNQKRGTGEPGLIAEMTLQVAKGHHVDDRRIFVGGLSAGAAMAVILGETYPDIFAAVGAHSGLPYASAQDIPSAMAAMKGRQARGGLSGLPGSRAVVGGLRHAVPTIVFHGDRDHTVQGSNATVILRQAMEAYGEAQTIEAPLAACTEAGTTPGGGAFSRSVYSDDKGRPHLESWTLHGAGHAWSGGSASGSYTDSKGPDASAAMVHFFLAQPRAGLA